MEVCPGCGEYKKLETHHFYPITLGDPGPTERKCRQCHAKIPKINKESRQWWNAWGWQMLHNTNPKIQERFRLGERTALIK